MLRESHLASVDSKEIGVTKISGNVIDFGSAPTVTIEGNTKVIPDYESYARFGALKVRVIFPKNYEGTMTINVNAGDTSASLEKIADFTASSTSIVGECYEAYVPGNVKRYMSIDVTPSVAMAGNMVYAEFVPNV